MALVSYSDSEASDSENENVTPQTDKKSTTTSGPPPPSNPPKPTTAPGGANFQSIVDRSNPRKIRVALPEIKPETGSRDEEDGPARKKPRIGGGGGGAFSGFNALLPAPKRNIAAADKAKKPSGPARKVFSLKTGAGPGFDREADAEMRQEMAFGAGADDGDETIPKAGSLRTESEAGNSAPAEEMKKPEEVKLKGNPMMFKPLSVGRNPQKKKASPKTTATPPVSTPVESKQPSQQPQEKQAPVQTAPPPAAPKPKISLFSLSKEDSSTNIAPDVSAKPTAYEPMVYSTPINAAPAGPEPDPQASYTPSEQTGGSSQTLSNIADDLNLSRAQRRHLFGRHADSAQSQVRHFNTDAEYVSNQKMLHETDVAATQHNPVRAIAPGKHTLQQLVNAASTQKEALEESFAAGKRNKQEAGSKYGW